MPGKAIAYEPSPDDLDWMSKAKCGDEDPELFFAEDEVNRRKAKAVCRRCPVQPQCLFHQSRFSGEDGTWGGKDGEGLSRARKRLRKAA